MGKKENNKREIFLEELPRKEGIGALKGQRVIDWNKTIGYKVKGVYEDLEFEVEIVDYVSKGKRGYLYIKYKDNELFEIEKDSFKMCRIGKLLGKITNQFRVEVGQILKDKKRDITIIDREYRDRVRNDCQNEKQKWYKYKCNKCGYSEGWIEEHHLLSGKGCPCCSNPPKLIVEKINSIVVTDPWMIPYFQGGYDEAKKYSRCSTQKIYPICPDCGRVRDKEIVISAIYKTKSIGCSCGDGCSYGHKYIFNLLTQFNQSFIDNHKFNWCKFYNPFKNKEVTGEYDFVLENNKLIIEVDGSFHKNDNKMNGQTKEESKFLDDEKDRLAIKNGYNIIRIMYDDKNMNIRENIINGELSYLFDLSVIDWNKCEEFALSNRVKEACELKKNNPDITTGDIAKIMNIGISAINKYLKQGDNLGWCNYDPEEERFRGNSKSGKMNGKQVEIFESGISLGTFPSCSELERQSEELFGEKLLHSEISIVCLDKRKQYKGFTFKYV